MPNPRMTPAHSSSTLRHPGFPVPTEIFLDIIERLHPRELSGLLGSCSKNYHTVQSALRKHLLISGRTDERCARAVEALTSANKEAAERRSVIRTIYLEHLDQEDFLPVMEVVIPFGSRSLLAAPVGRWEHLRQALSSSGANGSSLLPSARELHVGRDSAATMLKSQHDHRWGNIRGSHPVYELVIRSEITAMFVYDKDSPVDMDQGRLVPDLGTAINGLVKHMRRTLTRVDLTDMIPAEVWNSHYAPTLATSNFGFSIGKMSYSNLKFVFRLTNRRLDNGLWDYQAGKLASDFPGCSAQR